MIEEKTFDEKPIPLITEGFDLENDGIEYLQSLSDKNIAVISIIGPAASGKSFLANQIVGKYTKGFAIGSIENRTNCCTKGIWIWGKPIIKDDYYIVILDAQGLRSDTDENLEYSQKIFALCTLISSVVIYNYKKDDGSDNKTEISSQVLLHSYDLFNKLIPFLQKIKLEDNEELSEEANALKVNHIPKYYWVYRDYNIAAFDQYEDFDKKISSENKYYNDLFKNKINRNSLPCPMDENEMLVNVYLDEEEDESKKGLGPFSEDYKKKFAVFKKELIENCKPKTIKSLTLNGNLFYGILQEYASTIFSGEYMFVESPLTNVVFSNLGEITEGITDSYKEKLTEKNTEVIDIIQKVKNSFEVFSDGVLNDYNPTFIGKLLNSQFLIEEMNNILSSVSDELIDTHINENLNKYNDELKKFTETESAEKISKIDSVEDIKKNLLGLATKIKNQLDEVLFPKEKIFLSSFNLIKDYINKCICEKINAYAGSINFYIEHNLQTIESSSKTNEAALEEKIAELNRKDNELIDIRIKNDEIKRNMEYNKNEFQMKLETEKKKYSDLEKYNQALLDEKNQTIKDLELKIENLNKELQKIYNDAKIKNEDVLKIKQENIELKVNLGKKEKQLNEIDSKLKQYEIKSPEIAAINNNNKNLKSLKSEDIPKLKEVFKNIDKTVGEYYDLVNKLETNKDLIFYEKFIEESKSALKTTSKNWNEELSSFKEEHFKSMSDNYCKEISQLKEENLRLNKELSKSFEQCEQKQIEILRLTEIINKEKEMASSKEEIQKIKEIQIETLTKTIKTYETTKNEREKYISEIEFKLSENIGNLRMKEDEIESTLDLLRVMRDKNKKIYDQNIKKVSEEVRAVLTDINKRYKMIK